MTEEKPELNEASLLAYKTNTKSLINLKEDLRKKQTTFQKENGDLIENIAILSEQLIDQKEHLTLGALAEFEKTGIKQLLGGLGVQERVEIFYDEKSAFNWAKEHNLCLQLNKREFEKLAKTQEIDLVSKKQRILITFPKAIEVSEQKANQ